MHATHGSLKWLFASNLMTNTIRNMKQQLLVTVTPREFLMDGYNVPVVAAMKQLGGMASEDEDPNGRFSLMMAVKKPEPLLFTCSSS